VEPAKSPVKPAEPEPAEEPKQQKGKPPQPQKGKQPQQQKGKQRQGNSPAAKAEEAEKKNQRQKKS